MHTTKTKEKFLPESYTILSELAEAARLFEIAINAGVNMRSGMEEYEEAAAAAEAKLDALALQNPQEATKIFAASSFFDEGIDPNEEVYLGHGIIVSREAYAEYYGTVEAREELIQEFLDE